MWKTIKDPCSKAFTKLKYSIEHYECFLMWMSISFILFFQTIICSFHKSGTPPAAFRINFLSNENHFLFKINIIGTLSAYFAVPCMLRQLEPHCWSCAFNKRSSSGSPCQSTFLTILHKNANSFFNVSFI